MESMTRLIANAVSNAKKNIIAEECYKGTDGLLYCVKCNTPRQTKFGDKIVGCMCKCEQEKKREADKNERVRAIRDRCFGKDKNLYEYIFAKDDGLNMKVTKTARAYVDNFDVLSAEGYGLLFFGGNGTGKTFMAVCVANALIDQGINCYFTHWANIKIDLEVNRGQKEDYLQRLNSYDLLIVDDVKLVNQSEAMLDIFYLILENRINSQKPMIITTNMTAEEFINPPKTVARELVNRFYPKCLGVECNGEDRRKLANIQLKAEFDRLIKS